MTEEIDFRNWKPEKGTTPKGELFDLELPKAKSKKTSKKEEFEKPKIIKPSSVELEYKKNVEKNKYTAAPQIFEAITNKEMMVQITDDLIKDDRTRLECTIEKWAHFEIIINDAVKASCNPVVFGSRLLGFVFLERWEADVIPMITWEKVKECMDNLWRIDELSLQPLQKAVEKVVEVLQEKYTKEHKKSYKVQNIFKK